jgi:hypothetical protein
MKPTKSPYSKMYLVTPGVYDKLLTCLDEKDKKSTELLNLEKEREERPGEKVIEDITTGDFEPQDVEEIPQITEQQQQEQQQIEDIPPTPEVFGGVETEVQPQIEEGEILETMNVPPGEPDIQQQQQQELNPLRTPCSMSTDPNQVVQQPAFNPVGVRGVKRNVNLAPKIEKKSRILKPSLLVQKKPVLFVPQIKRQPQQQPKPQLIVPQLMRVQQQEQTRPDIPMPSADPKQFRFKSPKKAIGCPICMKVFPRPWNLARHVSTVHKNLGSVKDILENKIVQPVVQQPSGQQAPVVPQPTGQLTQNQQILAKPRVGFQYNRDIDTAMDENMAQFDSWIKPGKRKSTDAKLLTKPPIRRVKRGHVKPSPQDEQDDYEFESWN